jgi:hypothetical protein
MYQPDPGFHQREISLDSDSNDTHVRTIYYPEEGDRFCFTRSDYQHV